ncbi:uncharacterized protein LOC130655669 [Hydractinia symbiolongicarpus]|uniref:uncharacterized protein LOC130655669 n=1 Tax=Hydractinia symbiolongicarpus TaxID=13093 RepID=UPI0025517C31|nr:uncharacterized protein LOC130655669 [Hydractinia symbiolongicarpus]
MAIYAGVWASIASLALIACLVLGVYAQATFKWWEIKTNLADTEYYFGLYRICRSDLSGETCYRFDKDGMTNLMNDTIGLQYKTMNILEPETDDSTNIWIISFFYIAFVGISTFVSFYITSQTASGKSMHLTICIAAGLTLIGVSLGVTCIAYGSLRKDDLFEQGVTFLNKQGQTTTNVKFRGLSFKLQLISVCLMVLPFVIYMLLVIPTKKRYAMKKLVKEDN